MFKNMAPSRLWQQATLQLGIDVELKVPAGNGDWSIVFHLGSAETGLLSNCFLLFTGRKRMDPEYHSEMKSSVFIKWLEHTVFPELKRICNKSLLVLGRARYHTMLTEATKPPTTQWRKQKLVDFIRKWGHPVADDWKIIWMRRKTVSQLLSYARTVKPTRKYQVEEIADKFTEEMFNIKINFLPVAHPELNPIELVWGTIKRAVAKVDLSFRLFDCNCLLSEEVFKYGPSVFAKLVAHAIREEEKYLEMGAVLDAEEDFVVSKDGCNDDGSEEESCGNGDCLCSGSESVSK